MSDLSAAAVAVKKNQTALEFLQANKGAIEAQLAGAVNSTDTCVSPATPTTLVGAPGTVDGVALLLAADAAPVPCVLRAVTVNV